MPVDLNTIEYLAFEGGGGMGLAYVGTLAALRDVYQDSKISLIDERGCFRWPVKGVSGASAGAINALMMVLDYSPQETSDLVVRDGLFARLFSEKIKLEYHRAVASVGDRVKSGWYGNDKKYKKKKGDVENLNTLFDSCCSKTDDKNKQLEDFLGVEIEKNKGVYNSIREILKSIDNGDGRMILVIVRRILKQFNVPLTHDDIKEELLSVLWSATEKYISGSEIGFDAENAERFARLLNEAATEELRKTVPSWTVGKSDASGIAFWGLLLTYPTALLAIILYFVLIKRKVRENQSSDVIKHRSDIGRNQDKTGRIVGRENLPYTISLIVRIWWHNILTIDNFIHLHRMIMKLDIQSKIFSLYKILIENDLAKKKEDIEKVLLKLQEDGMAIVKKLFLAPFTKTMIAALGKDGGLLQGDVTRDILTTIVFNKYYVTPVGTGSDWKLVKRREALLTTLGRFEDDSLDLAILAQA